MEIIIYTIFRLDYEGYFVINHSWMGSFNCLHWKTTEYSFLFICLFIYLFILLYFNSVETAVLLLVSTLFSTTMTNPLSYDRTWVDPCGVQSTAPPAEMADPLETTRQTVIVAQELRKLAEEMKQLVCPYILLII